MKTSCTKEIVSVQCHLYYVGSIFEETIKERINESKGDQSLPKIDTSKKFACELLHERSNSKARSPRGDSKPTERKSKTKQNQHQSFSLVFKFLIVYKGLPCCSPQLFSRIRATEKERERKRKREKNSSLVSNWALEYNGWHYEPPSGLILLRSRSRPPTLDVSLLLLPIHR